MKTQNCLLVLLLFVCCFIFFCYCFVLDLKMELVTLSTFVKTQSWQLLVVFQLATCPGTGY